MANLAKRLENKILLCMTITILGSIALSWKNRVITKSLPVGETNNLYEDNQQFKKWLKKQETLKKNILKVCEKYGSSLRKMMPLNQFMYDSEHNLLFCRNAKVGTTTWLTNFLMMSSQHHHLYEEGLISDRELHTDVPQLFKLPILEEDKMKELIEKTVSFSIVRHPFERLVSAFQDKFVDQEENEYFNKVKDYIRMTYGEVTFTTFVYMIIDRSHDICKEMNSCHLNKHWKPYISRCAYCDIPYKIIAKAETFAEDQKYVGYLANITFLKIESHKSSGGDTKSLTKKYFSKLDVKTINNLYEIYKVDFEMFGYSQDLYINIASN